MDFHHRLRDSNGRDERAAAFLNPTGRPGWSAPLAAPVTELRGLILIVEDDADLRRLIEDALIDAGFDVKSAAHGAEGLRLLRAGNVTGIVLDLILPWVNGIEVLSTMRSDPRYSTLPVVVITGTATLEADLRVFRPLTVLRKPFAIDTVIDALYRMMEEERTSDDAVT
jgi:DNA-binding response OmpR family regulator